MPLVVHPKSPPVSGFAGASGFAGGCVDLKSQLSLRSLLGTTVAIAQLVRALIVVPGVVGSNPISHPSTLASAGFLCVKVALGVELQKIQLFSIQWLAG